jgi:hypothetical protein
VREQLGVVAGIRLRVAGIAGREHAGRAVQGFDAQAGVVGQRRQAAVGGGVAGLGQRVFDEGAVRLLGFRNAQLALGMTSKPSGASSAFSSFIFLALFEARTSFFMRRGRFLGGDQLADAQGGQVHQHVHLLAGEGFAFGRALDFDDAALPVMTTFMSVSQLESSG